MFSSDDLDSFLWSLELSIQLWFRYLDVRQLHLLCYILPISKVRAISAKMWYVIDFCGSHLSVRRDPPVSQLGPSPVGSLSLRIEIEKRIG